MLLMHIHTDAPRAYTPIDLCPAASIGPLQELHRMCCLQAAASPTTTPINPHAPQSFSSGACKGRGANLYTGDGSKNSIVVPAAKSQQSQPNGDLIAALEAHLPSSAMQPDTQSVPQPSGDPEYALEDASSSARQPGNKDMQLQSDIRHVEQQAQRPGSSSLPGQQKVQATEQLLQSSQHQPTQLGGQQAVVDEWQVPPQGQSEEGRPSRHTERSTGQKKDKKKKKGHQLLECERLDRWGHDKFEETQVFTIC